MQFVILYWFSYLASVEYTYLLYILINIRSYLHRIINTGFYAVFLDQSGVSGLAYLKVTWFLDLTMNSRFVI